MDDYGSVGFGARRVCLRRGTPAELHSASLLDRRRQLQPPPQFTRQKPRPQLEEAGLSYCG
jgi:hypothetical protein